MRRVVVTGIGIISCIGNNRQEVLESLRAGKSGISAAPDYAALGFRSQVHGRPDIDLQASIDKRLWRFMGDAAGYVHLSMEQAIADAGLGADVVSSDRTGIIVGSGGPSTPRAGCRGRYHPREGAETCRPVCGAQNHVLDNLGHGLDEFQD